MPFVLDTFSCLRDSVVVLFNMSCGILGDVNRDGAVDFFDISGFISALSSGSFQCEAAINMDGVVDFFDISPFIQTVGRSVTIGRWPVLSSIVGAMFGRAL